MPHPEAAVAIVHTRSQPESVLLMRRSERPNDSWSGHWSLPGGRCEAADPDLVHTALRELREECGVELTPLDLERSLPHTVARRKTAPYLLVAPFVFRVDSELPTCLDEREAVESLWIPVDTLRNSAHHVLQPVPGRPREMLFPCIDLRGTPLWGFTYRLLADWLNPTRRLLPLGAAMADTILAFVLAQGVELRSSWTPHEGVLVAEIEGRIPVEAVLSRYSGKGPHVSSLNTLEVGSDAIRILGPAWEEYRIVAFP